MISRVKRIYLRENKKENLFKFRLFQRRPSDGINFRKEKSQNGIKKFPAYYVFTNEELEKLVSLKPKTIEELRKLNEAGSSEEEEPSKEPGEGSEGIVEEEKNESSDKKDDTIVVEGNKNPEANKGDKLPNTGAEISFAIVLAGALALVGAGLALINEKKKIS